MNHEPVHPILTFFVQLLQHGLVVVLFALIVIFCLGAYVVYQVMKPASADKTEKWLYEKIAPTADYTQSQLGAIRAIHIKFAHIKRNLEAPFKINLKGIKNSIETVRKLCVEHNLPNEFVENFIDACIDLTNNKKFNGLYLALTTAYQR